MTRIEPDAPRTGRSRRPRLAATLVAAALAAAGLVGSGVTPADAASHDFTPPKIKHVWLIVLENKSYEASFTGLNQNSYLWKTLPQYGELLRQYYGTGHYSLDNYISLASGQAPAPDTQADCPQYRNVSPGTPAADGQTNATSGCVYPDSVYTLFNQLDDKNVSWKAYMQDMGNDPGREDPYKCGVPGDPSGNGVPDPGAATATDQYMPKHNPTVWFHSLIDDPQECDQVVPLDGRPAQGGHPAQSGLAEDLRSEDTTPAFSWITPDNCSDAHDSTCKGDNLSGDPNNHQGGLYASDLFLEKWIPQIMASPAFQDNGLIDITFDEAFPPYKIYGNSTGDYTGNSDPTLNTPTDTAQSVVACCNELPGPNTSQPGDQAFGQDTTPGGGITGSVLISRYIRPGTISDQPYNHYSWLRSMEDLFHITKGGTDGQGHLGYAGTPGLRPFGPDVYNNPGGHAMQPAPMGSNGVYSATSKQPKDQPALLAPDFTGPNAVLDSLRLGAGQ
ncbi:alkaline phosphatase family protein [Kitasatospora sp. NPDC052896]|uniref:alkaline phosphatase family protein n=1 Tax=Kitasatospora sp. NPDC052896 TaxID=3364061 RepID=UPI0037CBB5F4